AGPRWHGHVDPTVDGPQRRRVRCVDAQGRTSEEASLSTVTAGTTQLPVIHSSAPTSGSLALDELRFWWYCSSVQLTIGEHMNVQSLLVSYKNGRQWMPWPAATTMHVGN